MYAKTSYQETTLKTILVATQISIDIKRLVDFK